jgi:hypothetical protein
MTVTKLRNDPFEYTQEENTLFEAARQAVTLLKKTFDTWVVIGKAVAAARAKADRMGGGKTFRRILERQHLARVVPPATATRLLKIIENLPAVTTWHSGLSEERQIAWASPSAVMKHCPALQTTTTPGSRPKRKASKTAERELEQANARNTEQQEELASTRDRYAEKMRKVENENASMKGLVKDLEDKIKKLEDGKADGEPHVKFDPKPVAAKPLTIDQHFKALIELLQDEHPYAAQQHFNRLVADLRAAQATRRRAGIPERPLTAEQKAERAAFTQLGADVARVLTGRPARRVQPTAAKPRTIEEGLNKAANPLNAALSSLRKGPPAKRKGKAT